MKHDNIIKYDTFMWNWSKFALCDDALFIASWINNALGNGIQWPIVKRGCYLVHICKNFLGILGSLTAP
jgi:hypothetical protein